MIHQGIATIIFCLTYGLVATKLLMPGFANHRYAYEPLLPQNLLTLLQNLFSPPIKLQTIFYSLLSFGFLPLLSLSTWPLLAEHFIERFVFNPTISRWGLGLHYNSLLSPILLVGAIEALKSKPLSHWSRYYVLLAGLIIITVFVLHRFILRSPLALAYNSAFYAATPDAQFMQKYVDSIPKNSFLMTQNNIASHFTHQRVTLLSQAFDQINPDVIAIDLRPGQNLNNFYPLKDIEAETVVKSLLAKDSKYQKIGYNDTQYIFVRK